MLTWNVYVEDINRHEIVPYNVFDHGSFYRDVYKLVKAYRKNTKEALKPSEAKKFLNEFKNNVRGELMYYFWSKCEWEIVTASWPVDITLDELTNLNRQLEKDRMQYSRDPKVLYVNPRVGEKIDVYDQVMLNFDAFIEYILGRLKEFKKPREY